MDSNKKIQIKTAIAAAVVFLLIVTAILVTYKYSVEGEENMPFKISKIVIGSMVVSSDNDAVTDTTENEIVQNNGVYFEIQKNETYNKEAVIDSVEISNIEITRKPKKGTVKIYMPNTVQNKQFTYSNNYILEGNSLTYKGASKSDTTTLEINNQGGIIAISFGNTGLGRYSLTMLQSLDITNEDIEFTVQFDFIINTEGKKFKANIILDLPTSEIISTGKSSLEITDTSKYVFKRVLE